MTVVAIDASVRAPSCAIETPSGLTERTSPGTPVEELAVVIRSTLREAGVEIRNVERFVVGLGPGSYMGVRSAVATANALSFALDKPIAGVMTCDAVASSAGLSQSEMTAGVPAGRGRVFVATYSQRAGRIDRLTEPHLLDENEAYEMAASLVLADAAAAPNPNSGAASRSVQLSASSLLTVFRQQPHLVIEYSAGAAHPLLPSTGFGAA